MILLVGAIVASQLIPLGIPTTIVVPEHVVEPASVFLADYGRTPSLLLAVGENRMVAYAYGDWTYYALRKQGPVESVAALLWPTRGTLGRKEIIGSIDPQTVRRGIGAELQALHRFDVERRLLETLHVRLDRIYSEHLATAVQSYEMTFVHHPQSYSYWSNSNHMTANWLRELGCEIRGPAFSSWWRIQARR